MKTNNLKKTGILLVLSMMCIVGAQAQTRYNYLSIAYSRAVAFNTSNTVYVSMNGKAFTEEKIELSTDQNKIFNTNPLFNKVKEFEAQGWELLNIQSDYGASSIHYAYMRKKE